MFDLIFDFALLAAVYALIYKLRLKKRDGRYRVWFTLFYLYVCMVICVTLMPFQLVLPGANGNALEEINLEPFRDLKRALDRAVAKDSKQNTADKEDTDAR